MKLRLHKDTAAKLKAVSEWLGMTIGEVARRCLRSWHRAGEPSVDIWLLCDMATDVGSIPYRLRLDRADEVLPAPLLRAVLDWRLSQITVEPPVEIEASEPYEVVAP